MAFGVCGDLMGMERSNATHPSTRSPTWMRTEPTMVPREVGVGDPREGLLETPISDQSSWDDPVDEPASDSMFVFVTSTDPRESRWPLSAPDSTNNVCPSDEEGPTERLFDVDYSEAEGVLVVYHRRPHGRKRRRRAVVAPIGPQAGLISAGNLPNHESIRTANSRAYHEILNLAKRHDMRTHATLDYDEHPRPTSTRSHIRRMIRSVRREHEGLPYVAVTEFGPIANGIHHHVLLPHHVDDDTVRAAWTRGTVKVTHGATYEDLLRRVNYVTKTFWANDERIFTTRYSNSRLGRPARTQENDVTAADVDVLLEQLAGPNLDTAEFVESPWPGIARIYTWNPTHIPRGPATQP